MPYRKPKDLPTDLELFWTKDDGWGVVHPLVRGISAFGPSPEDALREYRNVWRMVKDEIGDKYGRTLETIVEQGEREDDITEILRANIQALREIAHAQADLQQHNTELLKRITEVLMAADEALRRIGHEV